MEAFSEQSQLHRGLRSTLARKTFNDINGKFFAQGLAQICQPMQVPLQIRSRNGSFQRSGFTFEAGTVFLKNRQLPICRKEAQIGLLRKISTPWKQRIEKPTRYTIQDLKQLNNSESKSKGIDGMDIGYLAVQGQCEFGRFHIYVSTFYLEWYRV